MVGSEYKTNKYKNFLTAWNEISLVRIEKSGRRVYNFLAFIANNKYTYVNAGVLYVTFNNLCAMNNSLIDINEQLYVNTICVIKYFELFNKYIKIYNGAIKVPATLKHIYTQIALKCLIKQKKKKYHERQSAYIF